MPDPVIPEVPPSVLGVAKLHPESLLAPEPSPEPAEPEPAPVQEAEEVELPEEETSTFSVDLSQFEARIARSKAEQNQELPPLLDDTFRGEVRTYNDLFAMHNIGGPEGFHVQVERKMPKVFKGVSILGMQKPLLETIDFQTFGALYGSGQYLLTVYGPTKNMRRGADGGVIMKAYTKPVRVDIPDPYGDNPPNPDMAAVVSAETKMPMTDLRRGLTTEADARIHESTLEHEDRAAERAERRRHAEELRERRQREMEEERAQTETLKTLDMVKELNDKVVQLAQQQRPGIDLEGVASLVHAVSGNQNAGAGQIESLRNHHLQEMSSLRDQHARALESLRMAAQADAERQRSEANERIRSLEAQHHRELSDERERARQALDTLRQETQRRIDEQARHFESRLSDERRQHDRDLQARSETGSMSLMTTQQTFELRLQTKDDELQRLRGELAKLQHELELEKSKDLATRIEEAERIAEALGFVKDEGGGSKSWQELLGEAALGAIQQAPNVAASVAQALRPPGPAAPPPVQQYQMRAQMPPQPAFVPAFATEDGLADIPTAAQAPLAPGEDPFNRGIILQPESVFPPTPPMYPPQQPMYPPPIPQQPLQQPVAAPVPAPVQSQQDGMVTDEHILQLSDEVRDALEAGKDPAEFAKEIALQVGPFLKPVLSELTLERITSVLEEDEDSDEDPLLRRDGQKFLAEIWKNLQKIAG